MQDKKKKSSDAADEKILNKIRAGKELDEDEATQFFSLFKRRLHEDAKKERDRTSGKILVYLPDKERFEQFNTAYSYLKERFGDGVRIIPSELFLSAGIRVVFEKIVSFQEDQSDFISILNLADNWEIYPRTDGNLCLGMMFYRLTNCVEADKNDKS